MASPLCPQKYFFFFCWKITVLWGEIKIWVLHEFYCNYLKHKKVILETSIWFSLWGQKKQLTKTTQKNYLCIHLELRSQFGPQISSPAPAERMGLGCGAAGLLLALQQCLGGGTEPQVLVLGETCSAGRGNVSSEQALSRIPLLQREHMAEREAGNTRAALWCCYRTFTAQAACGIISGCINFHFFSWS